jgi:hypothetical protein
MLEIAGLKPCASVTLEIILSQRFAEIPPIAAGAEVAHVAKLA